MQMTDTYKRGQVEWAVWHTFDVLGNTNTAAPPKPLRTRIKRLLEIDRTGIDNSPGFAFSDAPSTGQGSDAPFTTFDAFCLALALDLLDTGFKQAEVVFLLSHIRPQLREQFDWITSRNIPLGNVVLSEDFPDLPSFQGNQFREADFRVFALIQKVEIKEVFPTLDAAPNTEEPFIFQPVFCRGIEAMQAEINDRSSSFRKALVLELSTTAVLVKKHLKEAPITRRGRG